MTRSFGTLASFFVGPPVAAPGVALAPGHEAGDARAGGRRSTRPRRGRPARRRAAVRSGAGATAVVGAVGAAPFAVDLSVALAARDGVRCAVVAVWGTGPVAPPRGQATRAAETVVGRLKKAGVTPVAAGGRGIVVTLPEDASAAARVWSGLGAVSGPDVCLVLALCGARSTAFDDALTGCGQIVLVLAAGAPPALAAVAFASVRTTAPAARIAPVTLEVGTALPRPLRHRSVIRRALDGEQP